MADQFGHSSLRGTGLNFLQVLVVRMSACQMEHLHPSYDRGADRATGMSMSNDKSDETSGRILYQSEIFKDGPKARPATTAAASAPSRVSRCSAATRLRRKRAGPTKTHLEPAREIPVFAETDVLVVGGGPAGTAAAISAAPPRCRRAAGRALQPSGRAFDRRPRHLDRSHVGLVRQAHHPRLRQRHHGPAAQGGGAGAASSPTGARRTPRRPPTGRSARPRSTASSPGRRRSIRRRSRPYPCRW